MKVTVKFLATLYDLTGVLKEVVEVEEGITVAQLVDLLDRRFGGRLKAEIMEGGSLKPMYSILVNGRSIEWIGGMDVRLKEGDEVVFIPPAAGGLGRRDPTQRTRHSPPT